MVEIKRMVYGFYARLVIREIKVITIVPRSMLIIFWLFLNWKLRRYKKKKEKERGKSVRRNIQ